MATSNTAVAVGEVSSTKGEVFAKSADGQMRRLAVGDKIFEGEVIVTANGSSIEINMFNGPALHVAEQQTVTVDSQVISHTHDATAGAVSAIGSTEAAKVIQTVNTADAQDFNKVLDDQATAAGLTGGDGGGGHGFVDLVRIIENVPGSGYSYPSNPSGASSNVTLPGTPSGAPTDTLTAQISIDPVYGNNIINNQEALQPTTTITGTVTAVSTSTVNAGEIVTLTVNGNNYFGTVVQNPTTGALTYSIPVNTSDLVANGTAHAITVSVTMTDTGGNTSPSQATTSSVEIPVFDNPAATITLNNIPPNNIINNVETNQIIQVTGKVGGSAHSGDTVTLSIGNTVIGTGTVQPDGTYSIGVSGSTLAGATVTATVSGSDTAGSKYSATASDTVGIDNASATILINPVEPNNASGYTNTINNGELSQTIPVTGSVGGNAHAGDTVTLSIGNTQIGTGTVHSDGTYSINVLGSTLAGQTVTASVSGTDPAGSTYSATATETIGSDNPASATIAINPVEPNNANGFTNIINNGEISQTIPVTGSVGGSAHAGDTVTLWIGNTQIGSGTVQPDGTYSIAVAGTTLAGQTLTATVSGTNAAGSTYSATASDTVGTDNLNASITLDKVTGDNIINNVEAQAVTTAISGTVGGNVHAGDTVTLTIGTHTVTATVGVDGQSFSTANNLEGNQVLTSWLGNGTTVNASVSTSDAAGSSASASTSEVVNTDTLFAGITVDPIIVNNQPSATTTVTGTLTPSGSGANAVVGDIVTLTVNGHSYYGNVIQNVSTGALTYSVVGVPNSDLLTTDGGTNPVQLSVTLKDTNGSQATATATPSLTLDTLSASLTVDTPALINNQNVNPLNPADVTTITGTVKAVEAGGSGTIVGGEQVTLVVNGHTYYGAVDKSGTTYSVAGVLNSDLVTIDTVHNTVTPNPISVSATIADSLSSTMLATGTGSAVGDTLSASLTVDTPALINNQNVNPLNPADVTTITGTVKAAEAGGSGTIVGGEQVTLVVNGHTYYGAVDKSGTTYSVTGVLNSDLVTIDTVHNTVTPNPISVSATIADSLSSTTLATGTGSAVGDTLAASVTLDPIIVNNAGTTNLTGVVTETISGGTPNTETVTVNLNGTSLTATNLTQNSVVQNADGTATYTYAYSINGVTSTQLQMNSDGLPGPTVSTSVEVKDSNGSLASAVSAQSQMPLSDSLVTQIILNTPTTIAVDKTDSVTTISGQVFAGNSGLSTINDGTVTLTIGTGSTAQTITGVTVNADGTFSHDYWSSGLSNHTLISASVTVTDTAGSQAPSSYTTASSTLPATTVTDSLTSTTSNYQATGAEIVTINHTASGSSPMSANLSNFGTNDVLDLRDILSSNSETISAISIKNTSSTSASVSVTDHGHTDLINITFNTALTGSQQLTIDPTHQLIKING